MKRQQQTAGRVREFSTGAAVPGAAIPKATVVEDPALPAAASTQNLIQRWLMETSFRPSQTVQGFVYGQRSEPPAKPWHFHKLERGAGPLVLDYQELRITAPPYVAKKALTPDEICGFLRENMSEFMEAQQASVKAHSFEDRWRLRGKASHGVVLDFTVTQPAADKFSYVVSDHTADVWALTAVYSGQPGVEAHRVAGTRWLGVTSYQPGNGSFTLFTKAALRGITEPPEAGTAAELAMWRGFLTQVKAWVEQLGGKATLAEAQPPLSQDWASAQTGLFTPAEKWADLDGIWENKETRDVKKRFRLEIQEGMAGATLIEHGATSEIRRELRINGAGPGSWVIERPQDAELLAFLGVKPDLANAALATNPPPSTLTVTKKGAVLSAVWKGIVIQTNGQKRLEKVVTKSRSYELVRVE
jgi:hypothetical protein